MLTHEQVIAYLEETLPPEEAVGVEAEFTANAAAAIQLTELAQYDSALRTLLGGAVERARIEQSVLAAIHGKSLHEIEAISDNDLTKDQLAAQGIPTDLSGADRRQSERYREDLAEEAKWGQGDGKQGISPKPTPAPEAETQGEDTDYYNGLSQ